MSPDDTRRYVIAYDIPDDKRRNRLAKLLLSHGDRLQYSVFMIDCRPARLVRLRATIERTIDTDEDSVLVCDLGSVRGLSPQQFSYVGVQRPVTPTTSIIV